MLYLPPIDAYRTQNFLELILATCNLSSDQKMQVNLRRLLSKPQSQAFLTLVLNKQPKSHLRLAEFDNRLFDVSKTKHLIQGFKSQLIDTLNSISNQSQQIFFLQTSNSFTEETACSILEYLSNGINQKNQSDAQQQILNDMYQDMMSPFEKIVSESEESINQSLDYALFQRNIYLNSIRQDLSQREITLQLIYSPDNHIFRVKASQISQDSSRLIVSLQSNLQLTIQKEGALKLLINSLSNSGVKNIKLIIPDQSEQIDFKAKLNNFLPIIGVSQLESVPIRTSQQNEQQQYFDDKYQYNLRFSISKNAYQAIKNHVHALQKIISKSTNIQAIFLQISWRRLEQLRQLFPTYEYIQRTEQKLISHYFQSLLKHNQSFLCQIVQACLKCLCTREEKYLAEILQGILPMSLCGMIISGINILLKQQCEIADDLMQLTSCQNHDNEYVCNVLKITNKCKFKLLEDIKYASVDIQNYANIINFIQQASSKGQQQLQQLNQKECAIFFNSVDYQSIESIIPSPPNQTIFDQQLRDSLALQSQLRDKETILPFQQLSQIFVDGYNRQNYQENRDQLAQLISIRTSFHQIIQFIQLQRLLSFKMYQQIFIYIKYLYQNQLAFYDLMALD